MFKSSSQSESICTEAVWVLFDLGRLGTDSPWVSFSLMFGVSALLILVGVGAKIVLSVPGAWVDRLLPHHCSQTPQCCTHICTLWGYILGNRLPDQT